MASLLVKRVASNLLRVRKIASSSRFFSTKGYEFVQHDTKDECILKCDESLGSSLARPLVNDAFIPIVPPTENLARLLNFSDVCVCHVHGTHIFPRWSVVEDDKALYIIRDMTAKNIEDVRESVKEFVTGDHEENFNEAVPVSEEEYISGNIKENFNEPVPISEEYISGNVKENFNEPVPISEEYISGNVNENFNEPVPVSEEYISGNVNENFNKPVPVSEEEYISGNVKENFKQYDPLLPIIDIMRGDEYAPTGDYYEGCKRTPPICEITSWSRLAPLRGSPDNVNSIGTWIKTYAVPHKPQAVYILVVLGNPETRNPYGGYAMEIFLDNSLYNVCDMKFDTTGDNRKLFIPKKIVEGNKTIGGNLMFYCEKKFFKPTPWRPT
ncbi:hypothetical protein Tco_0746431 [Tanacetum coccineum]